MESIQISFRYSEADYTRAIRSHILLYIWESGVIIIIAILIGFGIYYSTTDSTQAALFCFGSVGVLLCFIFYGLYVKPVLAFRKIHKLRGDFSFTFSDENVHAITPDVDSRIQWHSYVQAMITKESYLLYYDRLFFSIIPKRFFESEDQRIVFEQMLAQHVMKIIRK